MDTAIDYTGSSLIGYIISYLIRLSPELFKIWHKWMDNKHELALLDRSSITSNNTIEDKSQPTPPVDPTIVENIMKFWNTPTGNKIVDIYNNLVRPNGVYILLGLFAYIKIMWFMQNPNAPLQVIWTKEDQMLLVGTLNFFYLNRVFDKK